MNDMVEEFRDWADDEQVVALVRYIMVRYSVRQAKAMEVVLLWSVAKVLAMEVAGD